jgi:hypothetical protein
MSYDKGKYKMIYIGFRSQFIPSHFQAFLFREKSVRNAGAFIVAHGQLTPGVLAKIKQRDDSCVCESRAGRRPEVPVRGCLWDSRDGGAVSAGDIV